MHKLAPAAGDRRPEIRTPLQLYNSAGVISHSYGRVISQTLRSRRRVIRLGRDGVTLLPLPVASGDAATMRLQWLQESILNPHDLSSGSTASLHAAGLQITYSTRRVWGPSVLAKRASLVSVIVSELKPAITLLAAHHVCCAVTRVGRSLHHGEFIAGCLATELHRTPLLGHLVMIHLGKGARRFRALWARGVCHVLAGAQSRPLTSLP